jgi:hypothetical protein
VSGRCAAGFASGYALRCTGSAKGRETINYLDLFAQLDRHNSYPRPSGLGCVGFNGRVSTENAIQMKDGLSWLAPSFLCLSGLRTHLGPGCSQICRDRLAPFPAPALALVKIVAWDSDMAAKLPSDLTYKRASRPSCPWGTSLASTNSLIRAALFPKPNIV